jgi:hypothetical protein
VADLKNELAWSFTRHETLLACPRRYWYRHYGHWGGWERDATPETREIYRLTKLEHRPTWQGKHVHAVVARCLHRARAGAPPVPAADLVEDVLSRMREEFRDSRGDVARISGKYKYHVRLFEHEERLDDGGPEWRRRWKETADTVAKAITDFLASDLFARLRALRAEDWIEIEDPSAPVVPSFQLEGVKVHVKLDCAYRERDGGPGGEAGTDRAVVIDWKTGRGSSQLIPMQLAAYALSLHYRHGVPLSSVRALEVNLVTGAQREHDVGSETLATFEKVFRESVARMRSFVEGGDAARNVPRPVSAFPFTQDDRQCLGCNFRSLCPKTAPSF